MQKYIFSYSVSTRPFDRNKDEKATGKLTWQEKQGTITDLLADIKNGFAYCPTFNHDGDTFSMAAKTDSNLKASYLISFDMDAVRMAAGEFYGTMIGTELTPSLVYTTANDGHFKQGKNETYNNRYRVIYVLDQPITTAETYTAIHQAMKDDIAAMVEDDNVYNDTSDKSVSHFFAGCRDTECYPINHVTSLQALADKYNVSLADNGSCGDGTANNDVTFVTMPSGNVDNTSNEPSGHDTLITDNLVDSRRVKTYSRGVIKEGREYYVTQEYEMTLFEEFAHEFHHTDTSYFDLYKYYKKKLTPLPEETPIEYDPDTLYKEVDEGYIGIHKHRHKVTKEDKDTWVPVKFKDGQRRRQKLYLYLQMVKAITPTATRAQLTWQAVNFIVMQVDNRKDPITKYQVTKIVDGVMCREWTPSDESVKRYGRKVKTNRAVAAEMGIPMSKAGLAAVHAWKADKKAVKWDKIAAMYDPTKSDKENVKMMSDEGMSITVQYLRNWKSKNGYTKRRKAAKGEQIATYYDPDLTDGQNLEQLAANGVNISLKTFKRWKADNGLTKPRAKTQEKPNKADMSHFDEVIDQLPTDTMKRQQVGIIDVFSSLETDSPKADLTDL
ncbi:MAG: hypothetical protein IKW83_08250 [Muribaculaceae bacterium]|nr:hypothetical protein [Bacteroidaceae bacterium]MBR5639740.1 hypothetical protein [Muribaculaceae bacterium]